MTASDQLNLIYSTAEARMHAGEPCKRANLPPCSYPAGDGPIGPGAWMTEEESEQAHQIKLAIPANDCAGALARLRAKHAARRARV